ncbi:MAG: outer membrane beta-barrel protein [Hyphomicrobiaceae bacterium]
MALARHLGLAIAATAILFGGTASATGFELAPASDAELGEISWQGAIISPDVSYDTLDLDGAGASLLEDPEGFRAGGEIGYDWQRGNFVLGVVGNATYAWIEGDGRGAGTGRFTSDMNYMGTLRGRLGAAFGRVMVYGTGGWAFGELEIADQIAGVSDSTFLSGWAAGGGLEYVWNSSITLRGEYIHLDYGTETYSSLPAGLQDVSAGSDLLGIGLVTRY